MGPGLQGEVLGGQAEGVPAHGVEHVEALHALHAAEDVRGGVALRVADVETVGRGVREHIEAIEFLARAGDLWRFEDGFLTPAGLPFGLDLGPWDALDFHARIIPFGPTGTAGHPSLSACPSRKNSGSFRQKYAINLGDNLLGMRLSILAALLFSLCVPALAGRDEGDARLTLDLPESPQHVERPIQPLPESLVPLKEARASRPEEDDAFKRELVVVRTRTWLTTGSVDTRISQQINVNPNVSIGETEQRGANGLMLVYSAEVAPIRWLSGEFQYGEDRQNGSYGDHFWVQAPGVEIQFPNADWEFPQSSRMTWPWIRRTVLPGLGRRHHLRSRTRTSQPAARRPRVA